VLAKYLFVCLPRNHATLKKYVKPFSSKHDAEAQLFAKSEKLWQLSY